MGLKEVFPLVSEPGTKHSWANEQRLQGFGKIPARDFPLNLSACPIIHQHLNSTTASIN